MKTQHGFHLAMPAKERERNLAYRAVYSLWAKVTILIATVARPGKRGFNPKAKEVLPAFPCEN